RRPEGFGEVQSHCVARSRCEAGNGVSEVAVPAGLVYGHGRRIGDTTQVDGIGVMDGPAAREVHIGDKWTHSWTAAVDLYGCCRPLGGRAGGGGRGRSNRVHSRESVVIRG